MKVTITAFASEKLAPAQYESMERSVSISAEVEMPDGIDLNEDTTIAYLAQGLQMRAEAQMYAALSRGMQSRGQKSGFLHQAAVDRSLRIAGIESIDAQSKTNVAPDRGVLN